MGLLAAFDVGFIKDGFRGKTTNTLTAEIRAQDCRSQAGLGGINHAQRIFPHSTAVEVINPVLHHASTRYEVLGRIVGISHLVLVTVSQLHLNPILVIFADPSG